VDGQAVSGTILISDEEKCWQFTPAEPWKEGTYQVSVASALEDWAGNSIGRPFEVDVFRPIQRRVESETIKLPIAVAK
jgi:hypothetical protein